MTIDFTKPIEYYEKARDAIAPYNKELMILALGLVIGFNAGMTMNTPKVEEITLEPITVYSDTDVVDEDNLKKAEVAMEKIIKAPFTDSGIVTHNGEKVLFCMKVTHKANGPFEKDSYTYKYVLEEKTWKGKEYMRYTYFPKFGDGDNSDELRHMGERVQCDDGDFNDFRKK